jgi:hypothetical protein
MRRRRLPRRSPISSATDHQGAEGRLKDLALTATDVEFSIGDGPLVKGPAVALLLAASGRSALLGQLSEPGASQLINRVVQA